MSETTIKYWTDDEDKQLLEEMLRNMDVVELSQIHGRSEFQINLRIHLLIHRMHVSGLSTNEIRKKTGVSLSEILGVIHPVKPSAGKTSTWIDYWNWSW